MRARGERGWRAVGVVAIGGCLVAGCGGPRSPVTPEQSPRPRSSHQATGNNDDSDWLLELFDHRGDDIGDGVAMEGYSVLIRYRGHTILFDGGTSATVLERNARAYGADLRTVDFAVLSHIDGDHTGGIDYLLKVNPGVRLYVPDDYGFGYNSEEERQHRPGYRYQTDNMQFVGKTVEIEDGVHLIHTTSKWTGYFSRYPPNENEPKLDELRELSLALETSSGNAVLVVGCSHSGVEVIVEESNRALGSNVALVTGGFHMHPFNAEYVEKVARQLKDELSVSRVAPTHCTGDEPIEVFRKVFGVDFVKTGLGTWLVLSD